MTLWFRACACSSCALLSIAGCTTPLDRSSLGVREGTHPIPTVRTESVTPSYEHKPDPPPDLAEDSTAEAYVLYALHNNASVEAAYQRWVAVSERVPQVNSLPDPRLTFGYFLEELQTRTGSQEARIGIEQTIPWIGALRNRKDAASRAALAAWYEFQATRLEVREGVMVALHELAYLSASTRIAEDNLGVIKSIEEILRARFRVGTESHPDLIRVQVELGEFEDRLEQLQAMRSTRVADLNAVLGRAFDAPVYGSIYPEEHVIADELETLSTLASEHNPRLLALDQKAEEQRAMQQVAISDGHPDLTFGLDYILTDDALNPLTPGSGDDPVLLRVGMTLPIWRDKYNASEREAIARRLGAVSTRVDALNHIHAQIQRAWFEHTDADRRIELYEHTLIPKASESLRVSLAGFRSGQTNLLDVLDTERTLLEFSLAIERAKSQRGKSLARLTTLVGVEPATSTAGDSAPDARSNEVTQ